MTWTAGLARQEGLFCLLRGNLVSHHQSVAAVLVSLRSCGNLHESEENAERTRILQMLPKIVEQTTSLSKSHVVIIGGSVG